MPKFNKENQKRIEDLANRIHTLVGRKLVGNEKNPFLITAEEIESHRGRIDKAIRLLSDSGHIKYSCTKKNSWGNSNTYYEVLTIDQTKDTPPFQFESEFKDIYNSAYSPMGAAKNLSISGYELIDCIGIHVLHVHWHPELYDFHKDMKEVKVYPKGLQEARCRSLLRSIVECHIGAQYANILAKKIGLPENSIPEEETKEISYRSCGHTFGMFNEAGMESYLQEYEFRIKYFQNLVEGIRFLREKARAAGGFEELIKTIRMEMLVSLKREAPKHLNKPENEEDTYSLWSKLYRHYESVYIMQNSEHWNYEDLYGQDTSVLHVTDRCVEFDQHDTFTPDEDDLRIVAATPSQLWMPTPANRP